jgi:hypothetical protein
VNWLVVELGELGGWLVVGLGSGLVGGGWWWWLVGGGELLNLVGGGIGWVNWVGWWVVVGGWWWVGG